MDHPQQRHLADSDSMAEHEHVFGNFHAYYSFNPANERLRFLTHDVRKALRDALITVDRKERENEAFVAIDVGCNEGNNTNVIFAADEEALRTVLRR